MSNTVTVKTYELKIDSVVHATGSVRTLADYAAQHMHRTHKHLTDVELDAMEATLRKTKQAELGGVKLLIESIEEEYEEDEDA